MSSTVFYNSQSLVGVGSVGIGTLSPITALDVYTGSINAASFVGAGNNLSNVQASPSFSGLSPGGILYAQSGITAGSSAAGSLGQFLISGATGAPTWTSTITASTTPVAAQNVLTIIGSSSTGNVVQFTNGVTANNFIMNNLGRIGIGTPAPAYALDLYNSVSGSNAPFIRLGGGGGSGNQVGIILTPWTGRSGGPASQIIAIDDGASSAHLTFWTAPSGSAQTSTERMRITDSGRVGINSSSPGAGLDVSTSFALGTNGSVLQNIITGTKAVTLTSGYYSGVVSIGKTMTGTTYTVFISIFTGAGATFSSAVTSQTTTQFTVNINLVSGGGNTPTIYWMVVDY
jgi:hypothetical protein